MQYNKNRNNTKNKSKSYPKTACVTDFFLVQAGRAKKKFTNFNKKMVDKNKWLYKDIP